LEVNRRCCGEADPSHFDPLQTSAPDFRAIWSIEQGLSRLPPIGPQSLITRTDWLPYIAAARLTEDISDEQHSLLDAASTSTP
jgi:hypothetical protein